MRKESNVGIHEKASDFQFCVKGVAVIHYVCGPLCVWDKESVCVFVCMYVRVYVRVCLSVCM